MPVPNLHVMRGQIDVTALGREPESLPDTSHHIAFTAEDFGALNDELHKIRELTYYGAHFGDNPARCCKAANEAVERAQRILLRFSVVREDRRT